MREEDLINTRLVLERWGDDVISSMKDILIAENKSASGKLINSLKYVVSFENNDLSIDFEMEDYGQYVDKGRRPGKQPPLSSIRKWLAIRGIQQKYAFPIAKNIGRFGIKPTPFFESTIESKQQQLISELSDAFVKDLDIYFQKQIDAKI